MLLRTKEHIVIAFLVHLHNKGEVTQLSEMANEMGVSSSYAEQIIKKMREAGFVHSNRGPGGGYSLKSGIDEISITDVIKVVSPSSTHDKLKNQDVMNASEDVVINALQNIFVSDVAKSLAMAVN